MDASARILEDVERSVKEGEAPILEFADQAAKAFGKNDCDTVHKLLEDALKARPDWMSVETVYHRFSKAGVVFKHLRKRSEARKISSIVTAKQSDKELVLVVQT